jgi:hypothetical protein
MGLCLWWGVCGPAHGQQKEPEPAPREQSVLIPYALAGVGALVVILLVCMPVRRD